MRKVISLFLTMVMLLSVFTVTSVTVSAEAYDHLRFTLNEDGNTYSVAGCNNMIKELDIPSVYNGKKVTKIADGAFMEYLWISEVILPETIETIGKYAFAGCTFIEKVDFPDGLKSVGNSAFNGCKELTSVELPDTVTEIGEYAFKVCHNLEKVVLPEGIKTIPYEVFGNCISLETIEIPKSVTLIDEYAFNGCKNLGEIVIPENVKVIGVGAFSGTGLFSVTIPVSLTRIGAFAFSDCDSITKVYYAGTKSQWNAISIERDNESLTSAEILYKNGECDHSKVETIVIKEQTCIQDGFAIKQCAICGAELGSIDSLTEGHNESDWITDKKATTSEAGSKHKECTTCKAVLETAEIPQLKCSKPKLKTIANTADGVKITWGKVDGADSYAVYRKTGSKGKYAKVGTATKTGYTDKKASSGKKYYYYVKAVNEAGTSSASSSKSIYYLADTTLKTPKSTKSGVTLNWTQITGADGYMVYRKTGSGDYKKIATVKGVKKVKYTDKSAKKGKTYTYKIKAYKSKTYSAYSNAKKIKDKY